MIAPATPPLAAPTMTASAVAMNRALPSPHPARKPTIAPTDPEAPASVLNVTIRARPASRVRFAPNRLLTTPVTSMATPVIAK